MTPVQCAKYQIISKSVGTISQDIESPIVSKFLNPGCKSWLNKLKTGSSRSAWNSSYNIDSPLNKLNKC